jgi:signal transduction histidine kinase
MALEVAFLYGHQITLESERHQLEHFARMGRAYAGLGHEIRTPLTTISNLVSLIPDRFDDSEFRDVLTRLIPGEVARIVKLTERLRLMAPANSAQLGPVDLRQVLAGIASIQSVSRNHIKVLLDLPGDLPVVRGDESQLIQLFMNLVNNAVEAMPDGGALGLRLQTSNSAQGHLVLTAYVIDEGPGIPKDIVDRVFEPFFTTKPSGTGLGLSICREIAGFHSAILRIFARDDRIGTIASVEFPLGPKHQATLSDFEAPMSTLSWASPNQ